MSFHSYHYVVEMAPVSKKNHQRIATNRLTGTPIIIQSPQYTRYEEQAGWYLRPKPPEPINYPVTVRCTFYMPTRRKVDTSNLCAAIHDILVKYRILADDCRDIIASTDGTRTYYDKEHPRTEISITPFEGEYAQWKE